MCYSNQKSLPLNLKVHECAVLWEPNKTGISPQKTLLDCFLERALAELKLVLHWRETAWWLFHADKATVPWGGR